MQKIIELAGINTNNYCSLNKETGEIGYYQTSKQSGVYTGVFFRDDNTFMGLYPTKGGPVVWYRNKEFPITKSLTICVVKDGKNRSFSIKEYGISIDYIEPKYIGFDSWSTELDLDFFYWIEQRYKTDEFYIQHTTVEK